MSVANRQIALCAALPLGSEAAVPDWIHLVPMGAIATNDGRGPYRVDDVEAIMAASIAENEKLVLDENHSTDLAAPRGEEAPARGWITALQRREDGIWGRVDWTDEGRRRVAAKEYRGVSPVIAHRKDGTVLAILRASLTNKPNFKGLTALHQEEDMDFRAKLTGALGLGGEADDDAIIAAIEARDGNERLALQSSLDALATTLGLQSDAGLPAVLAGVEALKAGAGASADAKDRVTALQSELVGLTTQLTSLQEERMREKAERFVDAAIARAVVGVKPQRDRYIALHMERPGDTEALINALPVINAREILVGQPNGDGQVSDPVEIAAHAATYQAKQAEAGVQLSFAAAVTAVMEGRHK